MQKFGIVKIDMARRSRKGGRKGSDQKIPYLVGGCIVALLGLGMHVALHADSDGGSGTAGADTSFDIPGYRTDASRLTGNRYRITARVENIDTLGNDRMVAVSVAGNKQERLPLMVPASLSSRVNLTRGDTFVFDVECRTGHDESNKEVKGILVVRKIETK